MTDLQSQHIIAIGASAGGIEEINRFFDHTPTDGVSYIIIQHLSPDFKSRMVELIAKHSKLKVKEAEDQMLVEINHVYVIPNQKFMTISNSGSRTIIIPPAFFMPVTPSAPSEPKPERMIPIAFSPLSKASELKKSIYGKMGTGCFLFIC